MANKKIALVLDDEQQKMLESLESTTRAESMAHVIRDALGVYGALHSLLSESNGNRIALINRTTGVLVELGIPSLQGAYVVMSPGMPIGEVK